MATINLTPEQLEAAKQAKSPEELVEIAKAEGIEVTAEQAKAFLTPPVGEISDEELANVAGGGCGEPTKCPRCGSQETRCEWDKYYCYTYCAKCGKLLDRASEHSYMYT